MPTKNLIRFSINSIALAGLVLVFAAAVIAQEKKFTPDVGIGGVKLGDRTSAKTFLTGFQPRSGDNGIPEYLFYNAQATSVLKLTAVSAEDPYFLTAIEVYSVGDLYRTPHLQLEKIGHFVTESGVFVGFRQSGGGLAIALISGIPNLARGNMIGPKDLVNKKGEPVSRAKAEDKETIDYKLDSIDVAGEPASKYGYAAQYYFYKNKLKRFSMKLVSK